jgi:flagellar hook-basal body complex protein FliE
MIQSVTNRLTLSAQGPAENGRTAAGSGDTPSFGDLLAGALDKVNALQQNADQMAVQMVAGQASDIHQVLAAAQEASLALQLTVQVRDKIVEAYQEMMRMQV